MCIREKQEGSRDTPRPWLSSGLPGNTKAGVSMQGLVKTQARIKKFVPHSGVTSADQDQVDQNRSRTGHTMPVLKPEGFDELAHDVRNILSALRLYCELFAEPTVFLDEIGELP